MLRSLLALFPWCLLAQNPIVVENARTGNPSSQWDIVGAGDSTIQGFATDISVNKSGTVRFKISTNASAYRLDIYRLGYYAGLGARLVATVQPSAPLPQTQPNPIVDAATGLIDCGNWAESASWNVPADATSGLYIAKLVRADTGGASHIPFVVRDDASTSDILFQTSDTTWQAYNSYGGNSLYTGSPAGRAYKVSYNRPFNTRSGATSFDWIFNAEYPMIRWLESNGYNVSYTTGVDTDRRGNLLLQHRAFLSVGHDEYWSGAQRANVEAARNAGIHLAFFSGNSIFWKTRWESSIAGPTTPYRTLVCYKETHANAKIDPTSTWTGTWRDPRFSPPSDGGRPENAVMGTIFTVNGPRNDSIRVPASFGLHRIWRNTTVATLPAGGTANFPAGTLGYEWDEALDNGFRPAALMFLSQVTVNNVPRLQDFGSTYANASATHRLTLYRHASGALVFGGGTVQWSWGLDSNHDNAGTSVSTPMRQATVNLFADMGMQPATLQPGLVAATLSNDTTAPTSAIQSPVNGASLPVGSAVTISGTAADTGGRLWGVEVSTDGGTIWRSATGLQNWTFSWTPTVSGTTTLRSRAFDDSGNLSAPGTAVTVTVTSTGPTLVSIAVTPANPSVVAGGTQQFTATGTYSNATTQNLTNQVTWASSAPARATINSAGLATGVSAGTTTISATLGSISGSTTLTVQSAALAITTVTLPGATVSTAYTTNLTASGGTLPYSWSVSAGSLPPGLTLTPSTGAISGTPTTTGTSNFTAQVSDASSPVQTVTRNLSITVTAPSTTLSIWSSSTVPGTVDGGADSPVELGVKFRSDVAGTIRGIRFYKASANTGSHIGNLWSSTGALLATATFINETASGWQQVLFSTPVSITANTVYVASYHVNGGHYSADLNYFLTTGVDNPPLHALANGVSGPNGVYAYGTGSIFPTQAWNAANYWVDVVFQPASAATLASIAVTPANPAVAIGATQQFTATGTYSDSTTQNLTSQVTWASSVTASATINSTGLATAVSAGTTTITATLGSVSGNTTLTVQSAPLSITTSVLPNATVGASYSATLAATGGIPPYTWSLSAGALPAGLTLNPTTGAITGTTTTAGTSNFTARVTDSTAVTPQTTTKALSITSTTTLVSIAVTPANPSIAAGATQQFTATGTYSDATTQNLTTQVTWASSVTARATINAAGLATAVSAGTTTISATSGSISGSTTLTVLSAPLAITNTTFPSATIGTAYSAAQAATGGTTPYSWSVSVGTLPTGLSINGTTGAITGTPTAAGTSTFTVRVTDASNPLQTATANRSITVAAAPIATSIWSNTTVPVGVDGGADNPVELGVKFRSDVAGTIQGIRFYKATTNTGTHVGNLWSNTGTLLATATFVNETASGWQQALFSTPVSIAANTVYVASYHANNGHYSADLNYFATTGVDNPPLHALASGVSGPNGVYAYGAGSIFPNQTFSSANYWVDVVFQSSSTAALASIAIAPLNPSIPVGATQQFTATGTYTDASTQNLTNQVTWASSVTARATINATGLATGVSAGTTTISATSGAISGSTVLTVQAAALSITTSVLPNATLGSSYSASLAATGGTLPYTWSISTGALPAGLTLNAASGAITGTPTTSGTSNFTVRVSDTGSPVQSVTANFSITVGSTTTTTIWPVTTVPGFVDAGPDSPVELGVKFRSDVAGTIRGIRFYKASTNTGTHVGNLWSTTGTLLATATFVNETASGWQQVLFSTPVSITANTVYVASYHANNGHYSANLNYFTSTGFDNAPLHALANGVSGPNGVFAYGAASAFPNQTYNAANYWVDVVFDYSAGPDNVAPTVAGVSPAAGTAGAPLNTVVVASFSELINPATITTTNVTLRTAANVVVPASVAYDSVTRTASLVPTSPLAPVSTYTVTLRGGVGGIADLAGNPMATDFTSTFTTITYGATAGGPGGPILIVTSTANPFSRYYAEILLAEGLNAFAMADVSTLSAAALAPYDVVILGQTTLTAGQVSTLTTWVNGGGNLIAMRPDKQLASLLGVTDALSTRAEGYLLVNTASGPGSGIVNQTIQYHGVADLYTLSTATAVAQIYSSPTVASANPAVTLRSVGTNGGQAAAFTFDLARSIVYTRQGNPAWINQERDGRPPLRTDDLFFGAATFDPQPDWINLDKVAIPQADEQQHLLANLIISMNTDRKPLPRFWFFPNGHRAVVVMTGDDHGNGGTKPRFDAYIAYSPPGGSVDDWQTVRSTSYVYATQTNAMTNTEAVAYNAAGFELALHLTSNEQNYTAQTIDSLFNQQLGAWRSLYPSIPSPVTHRMHAIVWSGYTVLPEAELRFGIRLDTNYYFWPGEWVGNRPGLFTGSGLPMRFARTDGSAIDVYQAATQMTDESLQTYPFTIDTLLNRALGAEGYYGAFVANMHTDSNPHPGSDSIVLSAMNRGVPIISARQLLTWTDARNSSSIRSIVRSGNTVTFTVDASPRARGLQTMIPLSATEIVNSITFNGAPIAHEIRIIKGVRYAVITSASGNYSVVTTP